MGSVFDNNIKVDSSGNVTITGDLTVEGATTTAVTVDSGTLSIDGANNRVGIGDTLPGTQLQMKGTAPYVTLQNSTAENTAGGCESKLIFEDHGNNALGQIEVSHVGTSDDEKGQLILKTNNDSGLQTAVTINESQQTAFSGNVSMGVDDTGVDVRIYSATASEGILYDASEDELGLLLTTKLKFHDIGGGEEIYASSDGHLEVNAGTTLDMTAPTVDINASTIVTVDSPVLALGEGSSVGISAPLLPSTDHTSTGLTAEMLAGGAIAAFETVCIHTTTGEVVISDADAIGTMPVIGIAPAAISDTATGTILLQGFIRDDTWNWTLGGILYASGTAGAMTQTAPTGSGDFVQAVGIALSADVVYFNPSLTLVEVA